jgi:L-ribulose-5-phosphate 3-epimerase
MHRRKFMGAALGTALLQATGMSRADSKLTGLDDDAQESTRRPDPDHPISMPLGLVIRPSGDPDVVLSNVKALDLPTCFLSLDSYLNGFSPALAERFQSLLHNYGIVPTAAEVVNPGPLVWDFMKGPSTVGLVPRETRAARIDALKRTSDFANLLRIKLVQTHCGFIPEDPANPLYDEVVAAIQEVARHCAGNGQCFLMETGQETPTTMARAIEDVAMPNLGVGLDTANLILYGKANPVDALGILAKHVKSVHAKDGLWPTDPRNLGKEVVIGSGLVDFKKVFQILRSVGYSGAISIEREIEGPNQLADVKLEKAYLEGTLAQI